MIEFTILGTPRPLKRHRTVTTRTGFRQYDPNTQIKRDMLVLSQKHVPKTPLTGALMVTLHFTMPRPKSHYRTKLGLLTTELKPGVPYYHAKKPDIDNLIKLIMDALNGVFWRDDSQIARITAWKMYGEVPSTRIIIRQRKNL